MDAGAFSDSDVIKATDGLKLILVDCSARIPSDMSKYGVKGFPTVLFTDPDGNKVAELGGRGASQVASQMRDIAAKHSRVLPWSKDVDKGFQLAKEKNKPALVFFYDPKHPANEYVDGFFCDDSVQELVAKYVLIKHEYSKKDDLCKALIARSALTVCVYDPGLDSKKPLSRMSKVRSPKVLKKGLTKGIRAFEKSVRKRESAAAGG